MVETQINPLEKTLLIFRFPPLFRMDIGYAALTHATRHIGQNGYSGFTQENGVCCFLVKTCFE